MPRTIAIRNAVTGKSRQVVVPGEEDKVDIEDAAPDLDALTKAELLTHADTLGIEVPTGATKANIRALIEGDFSDEDSD